MTLDYYEKGRQRYQEQMKKKHGLRYEEPKKEEKQSLKDAKALIADHQSRKAIAKVRKEYEQELGVERGAEGVELTKTGDIYKIGGKKLVRRMKDLAIKISTGKATDKEKEEYKKIKGE